MGYQKEGINRAPITKDEGVPLFGWHQVCGLAKSHFFVEGRPLCWCNVAPLHTVKKDNGACKNCLEKIQADVDDKYNYRLSDCCIGCKNRKKVNEDEHSKVGFCTFHQCRVCDDFICDLFEGVS